MGKASSNKKVARAAGTGGGRTARGRTPWLWYGGLSFVMLLGVFLVSTSRSDLNTTIAHPDFKDHWHMAYGINICGEFKPPMPQPPNLIGLHTHTDGLIHVEPVSVNDTGKNATVGRFASGQPGFKISATSIQYPGDKAYKNGDKCGSKAGHLETWVWVSQTDKDPQKITGDPKKIKIENFHLITFAFVPNGTKVAEPPSAANLADPNAGETQTPASVPEGTPTTVAATPTTAAPAATPTTAAPTAPTTAAP
jgi:hypothetical protein